MTEITVISGSTLGNAEYVAEHLSEKLNDSGFNSTVIHGAEFKELQARGIWLIVTSTHGAGELPDSIQPLFEQLEKQKPDLSQIRYGAVGLGSSEYDIFCGGIKIMDELLSSLGAKKIGIRLEIDVTEGELPEVAAEAWLSEWITQIK